MAAEALPAPMTMSLPRGGAGRCGGMHTAGCAEAMAASNIRSNSARGAARREESLMPRRRPVASVLVNEPIPSILISTVAHP